MITFVSTRHILKDGFQFAKLYWQNYIGLLLSALDGGGKKIYLVNILFNVICV